MQHVYVLTVISTIEMQGKKKAGRGEGEEGEGGRKCTGEKNMVSRQLTQSVLWVIEGPDAHRQFSCTKERFHFVTL